MFAQLHAHAASRYLHPHAHFLQKRMHPQKDSNRQLYFSKSVMPENSRTEMRPSRGYTFLASVLQSSGRFGNATSRKRAKRSFFATLDMGNLVDHKYSRLRHSRSLSSVLEAVVVLDKDTIETESKSSAMMSSGSNEVFTSSSVESGIDDGAFSVTANASSELVCWKVGMLNSRISGWCDKGSKVCISSVASMVSVASVTASTGMAESWALSHVRLVKIWGNSFPAVTIWSLFMCLRIVRVCSVFLPLQREQGHGLKCKVI